MSAVVALATHSLGKRYGPRWALREVNLSVPAGSIAALVGPNGAGKTTLLQLVMGLLAPTEGSVEVFGGHAAANTPAALSRVGFVAQDHPLYGFMRVGELLRFAHATNRTFDAPYARARLDGLGIDPRRRASRLSGGQQAEVALVLALAKRPRLLVLDEPVASLDPLARREFLSVLMDEAADGHVSVLLSSQALAEAATGRRPPDRPESGEGAAGRGPGGDHRDAPAGHRTGRPARGRRLRAGDCRPALPSPQPAPGSHRNREHRDAPGVASPASDPGGDRAGLPAKPRPGPAGPLTPAVA